MIFLKKKKQENPVQTSGKPQENVVGGGGWPMRGRDLIMWSEGLWEALKKLTWKGDRQTKTEKKVIHVYEQLG